MKWKVTSYKAEMERLEKELIDATDALATGAKITMHGQGSSGGSDKPDEQAWETVQKALLPVKISRASAQRVIDALKSICKTQ
jgi:hypothetical protein